MKTPLSYHAESKIKALSKHLGYLAYDNQQYIEKAIKAENLQYNLSLILSHIILKLHFVDRSKHVFETTIQEYNQAHDTKLTFDDFEKINWIRIIAEEIKVPRRVSHFVWQVGYYENEGKLIDIPTDKIDIVRCLQLYSTKSVSPSITKAELEDIINQFAHEITIDFLVNKNVLEHNSTTELYYWRGGNYTQHLGSEIAATLWLLMGNENTTIEESKKFFNYINKSNIWIRNIEQYLPPNSTNKIRELAIELLNNESDLLQSDAEFTKVWLDEDNDRPIDIQTENPAVKFNYENSYEFINSILYINWQFQTLFDYQRTRNFCYQLLQLIIPNELNRPQSFLDILRIFKDISKPFLVWKLYQDVPRKCPQIIPYLLTDTELAPIAFKLIDRIKVADGVLLVDSDDHTKKTEDSCEIKNQIWLDCFDFIIEQYTIQDSYNKEKAEALSKILGDLAEQVFSHKNNQNRDIEHKALRERYDKALKRLSRQQIKHSVPAIILLFSDTANFLSSKLNFSYPHSNELLHLNSGRFDLSIEVLRLKNKIRENANASDSFKNEQSEATKKLTISLYNHLKEFYSLTEIEVHSFFNSSSGSERKTVHRGVNDFGFEIIDWGYLFLHFAQIRLLDKFHENFVKELHFNKDGDKYDELNKEQYEKLKLYLKSLMLAFISISKKRNEYEIRGFSVQSTLSLLERWVKELSLKYSTDDFNHERIDVFYESYRSWGYNLYHQHLTPLLYKSINYFSEQNANEFIEEFFYNSIDIGRMLTAINALEIPKLRETISQRVLSLSIDDFIKSRFSIIDLEYALVEAVNSEKHWNLAEQLATKIQDHFNRVKHYDERSETLLYEVNLHLAFKENNFKKLENISFTKNTSVYPARDKKLAQTKQFYIALLWLYNEKEYDEAIKILRQLLTENSQNIRYAFHLYQAETQKAIKKEDITLFSMANQNWDNFIGELDDKKSNISLGLEEAIAVNKLYHYVASKDAIKFDQTINILSEKYLYDIEIIPTIYQFYVERDLQEAAVYYIQNATNYLTEINISLPANIQNLRDNSEDVESFKRYRIVLERISNLQPKYIPSVSPPKINDKRQLNTFILKELIQALNILSEKREAIKQITHENRYNDYLQAILRFRFPIWGWSIHDQSRTGTSTSGKDAGEADLLLQSGSTNFALIEAFILRDKKYSETHILKCPQYINSISRYYIIIYNTNEAHTLTADWKAYSSDVLSIDYPESFGIDATQGLIDLTNEFNDINNLKVAKTLHQSAKIELFHIMVKLK